MRDTGRRTALAVMTLAFLGFLASAARAQWQWTYTDLHPAGANASSAEATTNSQQAGWAAFYGRDHAGIWSGTAGSWVDLHPPGAWNSHAAATTGTQQAGSAAFETPQGIFVHAGIWSGTPESWIDLHPAGAIGSGARATTGIQQAGSAIIGLEHAGIWHGTAASWVDLHPPGMPSAVSVAYATVGTRQAGFAGNHASLWSGTPESWVNLHEVLGPTYSRSEAASVFESGGVLYVSGWARMPGGPPRAILWTGIPEPSSLAALALGAGVLTARRRRCRS